MLLNAFFRRLWSLKIEHFHFRILFSQFWMTFPRKLMKRPAVFITYFQSPFQMVQFNEFYHLNVFFQKDVACFNLLSVFLALNHFSRK